MHKLYFIARDNMTHDVTDNGGLRVSQRGVPDTEKVTNQFLGIFSTDCMKILIGDGEVRTQRPPPFPRSANGRKTEKKRWHCPNDKL